MAQSSLVAALLVFEACRGAPAAATSTADDVGAATTAAAAPIAADLPTALAAPERRASRRARFAGAVEQISTALGSPITAERALADMPCGGWSGPACSNLAVGLEAAKLVAPFAARLYDERAAAITQILVEAVSTHSVWHDAFGYVQATLGGPGYTYAGCLFSRCDAADYTCGQIDGLLYQVGRLLGVLTGPECGPRCTLGATPGRP
jgi:hypothetical protein